MIEHLCEWGCCTQVMEKERRRLPLFNDVFFSDRNPPFWNLMAGVEAREGRDVHNACQTVFGALSLL